ncbi:hypothetical protein C1645_807899 [Glomus cerebriforme]|uniref:Ser-Thr-rich glycosyl-phosphatidyl-inositol-anchored membrane family-domain-containing protein n=1 Tax=Glomus cerebriforme TaxID=658196 RepID=A0A397SQH1_9GLOM|nr:hypothetical protein C1645_807899 [Glomus cerebriforme]
MKFFLLPTLIFFTLILCITSLPQEPDFAVTPKISVKLVGPNEKDKEPAIPIFPLNSDLKIEWTSEGIKENPIVLLQVFYIFPTLPNETYVPLLKEPKDLYLNDKSFKLKLDSNLFEAEEKFYMVTVTMKDDQEVVGKSKSFGVCSRCE